MIWHRGLWPWLMLVLLGCPGRPPFVAEVGPVDAPPPVTAAPVPPEPAEEDASESGEPEGEGTTPPPPEPMKPTSSLVPPDAGYPPKLESEATCDALAAEGLRELQELEGPCETAHDCELIDVVCPFGCYAVISKVHDRSKARDAIARYFEGCRACKNKCRQPPVSLACAQGRCFDARLP